MGKDFSNLTYKLNKIGDGLDLALGGAITGESVMPVMPTDPMTEWHIDLKDISHINSGGVRNWMNWIGNLRKQNPEVTLDFQNIPYVFIRQMATIKGFIPESAKLSSMHVPYTCPNCGAEEFAVLKHGINYCLGGLPLSLPDVKCTNCPAKMDLDSQSEDFLVSLDR